MRHEVNSTSEFIVETNVLMVTDWHDDDVNNHH
jgi:hypothetical protein